MDFTPEESAVIEQAIICLGHSYHFRDGQTEKARKIYDLATSFRVVREQKFTDMQIGVNAFGRVTTK